MFAHLCASWCADRAIGTALADVIREKCKLRRRNQEGIRYLIDIFYQSSAALLAVARQCRANRHSRSR